MDHSPDGPIITSVFELFKAGPGPSSSHTIGPMAAALDFRRQMEALPVSLQDRAAAVEVRLFGSLSATHEGHGTVRAIIAGLLGFDPVRNPDAIPADIRTLSAEDRRIPLGSRSLAVGPESLLPDSVSHDFPFSNTLIFSLLDVGGSPLFQARAYSVGGGFVQWEGRSPPFRPDPPYPYRSAEELRCFADRAGLTLAQIVLSNEMALSGRSAAQVREELDSVLDIMRRSVQRGIRTEGVLPGSLGVYRKAAHLARKADALDDPLNRFLGLLNAYAFAVAEENAAGGVIVTAPTCGSAGVIPAILTMIEGHLGLGPEAVSSGLLAAAAVGFLAKNNAGIAGAEMGCQGEVGVAAAMAAAMLAQARGFPPQIVENAAEIALEHHLGLTCDPVGGYVQIPCIERNAMGALKAYNACLVAATEDVARHRVSLDTAIRAMRETGRDMSAKYKETALGGLALCLPEC
ncbi:MAG: L-serine ammonia-lyase [Desulfovibrio sp.]|jgi:L-serine dehydratase|nr:L-serine ammonia-lyase [Desulfovibrio sp.]